ncbi:AAA family ATPase [Agrobacterium tumefaciens]|uniref:AAA family ATPase n=1 Tax=Agrobacterium tumefaciens TaxID=358 RepID=UPI00287C9F17|nr:AAA family ATPase [Agrobacterium tumefaciens]MDS7595396.1 AAA family ATPase [Agrobacterium tumefaciens]
MESYSENLFANRDPFHSVKYELTLATQLAIVSISRPIKRLLKRRSSFVAAFVLPPKADPHAHKMAAKWLLAGTNPTNSEPGNNYVLFIDEETDLSEEFAGFRKLREVKRAIILLRDDALLTDEVRIASDIIVPLSEPSARDYRVAAHRMGVTITTAQSEFLAAQSVRRVELAWRRGRSMAASVKRLSLYPATEQGTRSAGYLSSGPTLHELAGYGEARDWGISLAEDLKAWREGGLSWADVDCGILLSGPPGSGKTLYAAALARTCNVPLILGSAARWQARGHLGDMLKAMRRAFADAEAQSPAILLIDEFDSFTNRDDRTGSSDNYHRQVINALLELLDGAQAHEGVVVIGATNYPGIIDPALLRAGRLELHFSIPLPNASSRQDIFRFYLREALRGETLDAVVKGSEGWSGADIERCVREARRAARRAMRPISLDDLLAAMPPCIPVPLAVQRCVAAHELGHAILGVLLETEPLVSVSIARTIYYGRSPQTMGRTEFDEQPFNRRTVQYFRDKIATLLGGVAAEELLFSNFENGAGGDITADLNRATDLATMMEITWGLGKTLTVEPGNSPRELAAYRNRRKSLAKAVEATLQTEFARAKSLLEERREVLIDLHAQLVREGTLTAAVVQAAVGTHGR